MVGVIDLPYLLIAREAGAVIMDSDGSPHTFSSHATIAVNQELAHGLLTLVRRSSDLTPTSA